MGRLSDVFASADDLLGIAPEDFGLVVLRLVQEERGPKVHKGSFLVPLWNENSTAFPHHRKEAVEQAFAEAWQWLEHEGLLMPAPETNGYYCLTRKAKTLRTAADVEAYQESKLLPISLLHPRVAEKARPMFMRGDYDVAVFQAFKDVEIAVRKAANLSDGDIGKQLMHTAFKPAIGPLTVKHSEKGEQVALMELFAGAIGHCKNPASHRSPSFGRVAAAQLIAFASYLLTQVDEIVYSKTLLQPGG